jgi:hypothetical protein
MYQDDDIRRAYRKALKMDLTLNWLVDVWNAFSLWTSTQPTFVQVAFGMGLFYGVWFFLRMLYRVVHFTLTGLFAGTGRSPVKRDMKPPNRAKKQVTLDDDSPPFVFR